MTEKDVEKQNIPPVPANGFPLPALLPSLNVPQSSGDLHRLAREFSAYVEGAENSLSLSFPASSDLRVSPSSCVAG